jgi:bifunctional non-homologous end joining protein LigD
LVFAGAVGSGFSDAELVRLAGLLAPLQVDSSPFDTPVPHEYARYAVWVKPVLGGEARFRNWTADGLLRHP